MQLLALAGSIFLVIYSVAAEKPVGPCEKARQDAGHPIPGRYIPQCTEFGYFKAVQCHGSTGRCWCVVPDTGVAIEGTSVMRKMPECSICHIQQSEMLRPVGFVGNFVPRCTEEGLFMAEQHWGSIGHRWCVNKYTGEEIEGTRRGPGDQRQVDCEEEAKQQALTMHFLMSQKGPCFAQILEQRGRSGTPGFYTPRCTENGYYRTEQHSSNTKETWCANPITGQEIPETRRAADQEKVECGACFKEIEELLMRRPLMGSHLAQCNMENGNYLPEQFFEGYRWCANPKTGAVEGKKYAPGDNTPLPCVNH